MYPSLILSLVSLFPPLLLSTRVLFYSSYIFQLLSSILHLGNITFTKKEEKDEAVVESSESVEIVCEFLQFKKSELEDALVKRKITVGPQTYLIPLQPTEVYTQFTSFSPLIND